MKTTFTYTLFVAAFLSLVLYSCQKEETVRVNPPNKTTTTVATTVPVDEPTGGGTSKPTGGNPANPSPGTPANPDHPVIDPGVNISNSVSCRNCHIRVETTDGMQWGTTGTFSSTATSPSYSGMRSGSTNTTGK